MHPAGNDCGKRSSHRGIQWQAGLGRPVPVGTKTWPACHVVRGTPAVSQPITKGPPAGSQPLCDSTHAGEGLSCPPLPISRTHSSQHHTHAYKNPPT